MATLSLARSQVSDDRRSRAAASEPPSAVKRNLVHRRRDSIKRAEWRCTSEVAGAISGFGRSPRKKASAAPARKASAIAAGDWSHLDGAALVCVALVREQ